MMAGEIDLNVFAQHIIDAAQGAASCIFATAPGMPNPDNILTVAMKPDDMARVTTSVSSRVVYLDERSFPSSTAFIIQRLWRQGGLAACARNWRQSSTSGNWS